MGKRYSLFWFEFLRRKVRESVLQNGTFPVQMSLYITQSPMKL